MRRLRAQMRAVAHLVGLVNPAGELVVKLAGRTDAELVNVQSSGIRTGPGDAGIVHAPLQVQVSAQRAVTRPGSGEAAAGTLQGNRALRHRIGKWAASAGQLDEPVIQRDDFRRPAGQVPLNGPLGVGHSARLSRTIATGLASTDGSGPCYLSRNIRPGRLANQRHLAHPAPLDRQGRHGMIVT